VITFASIVGLLKKIQLAAIGKTTLKIPIEIIKKLYKIIGPGDFIKKLFNAFNDPLFLSLLSTAISTEFGKKVREEELYKIGKDGLSYYYETLGEGGESIAAGAYQKVFKPLEVLSDRPDIKDMPRGSYDYYVKQLEGISKVPKNERRPLFDKLYAELQKDTAKMNKYMK
jgi:hypothetical protein